MIADDTTDPDCVARAEADHVAVEAAATTIATREATIDEANHLVVEVDRLEVDVMQVGCVVLVGQMVEVAPPPRPNQDDIFGAYIATQANVVVSALHAQVIGILNTSSL
jgi:hypothetical protein